MEEKLNKIFGFSELGVNQFRKLSKKTFYEQDTFDNAKKKLFTEKIDFINIVAVFDKITSNIPPLQSSEILCKEVIFIQVDLKKIQSVHKIAEIFHSVIPNPVILIFTHGAEVLFSTGFKRLSKSESNKTVLESVVMSPWIDSDNTEKDQQDFLNILFLKNLSFDNLYALYMDISKAVISSNFIEIVGEYCYPKYTKAKEVLKTAVKLKKIQEDISHLQSLDKQFKHFGDKVANNQKLLDKRKEMESIKETIINLS